MNETAEEKVYTFPTVITGGKSGQPWLTTLPKGSVFFVKEDREKERIHLCVITFKWPRTVKLYYPIHSHEELVDPVEYSKTHQLWELLQDGESKE